MIRLSTSLVRSIIQRPIPMTSVPSFKFAKQPKAGKDPKGGKQQKKPQTPVVQQPTQKLAPYQKMLHYFTPIQPGLSPSQAQALQTRFNDFSQTDKEILDQLAERIAGLNTSMFYDLVYKREALGTTEGFVVGSGKWEDDKVEEAVAVLRKDL